MTTLSKRLTPIVEQLDANEASDRKPVQKGDARMALVEKGLQALADFFNFPVSIRYIATGELEFFGKGETGFGEGLAAILSKYPTRTGIQATTSTVLPCNGWTRINHFVAEQIIREQADVNA
ncbi:MAG: hypothetical protein CBC55_02745 [Gammaproteobacteria bacterium TMED95]|nr:MAG: hypothetical protein CBC55_02745 [Gammaproteobacteria bacterium TMED95]|tara:strand:+ start:4511 stop:4876 length:366 start_codon:yes stop_codon:yes gene_type:complete